MNDLTPINVAVSMGFEQKYGNGEYNDCEEVPANEVSSSGDCGTSNKPHKPEVCVFGNVVVGDN